jgi:hypothetical protein
MVHRGFFEDRKSDYGIAEEKQEVCMDREMCGSISKAQGVVDDNTDTKRSLTWMRTSWYALTHPRKA